MRMMVAAGFAISTLALLAAGCRQEETAKTTAPAVSASEVVLNVPGLT
ncbi:MAG: hypothetical protein HY289_15285 [Planctomycetes bacterium]|nr:hypothetical protein [Planctomycetota bacterium]